MKQNIIRSLILVGLITVVLILGPRTCRGQYVRLSGFVQGTSYHVTYQSRNGENFQREIDSLLADFDKSLSIYLPSSIVSRINQNDPGVLTDEKFNQVFKKSLETYKESGGAFDITVAPLVNAWGFGSTHPAQTDSALIDSLLQYVGMKKVRLSGNTIIKENPNVRLDFNAIAQGYSVDVVAHFLAKKGIRNYMVEIGGEIRTKGKNDKGMYWRIGIDKPIEGNMIPGANMQAILQLNGKSLATAGNYRKFYEKNGIKYVHTINPATGYPVISNLLSVTVIADDCITADAFDTAFMVMGLEKTIAYLEKHPSLDAYLVYIDEKGKYRVYSTKGIANYLVEQL